MWWEQSISAATLMTDDFRLAHATSRIARKISLGELFLSPAGEETPYAQKQ
jgi:hypothetical protein